MTSNREAIYAEIYARIVALKAANVVVDCSRRLTHWEDLAPSQMPFVCMVQMPEQGTYTLGTGVPAKWRGSVRFVVYVCNAGDSTLVPAIAMNQIIDAIDKAFEAFHNDGTRAADERDGRCTLSGLVQDCRVSGDVELDDGSLGQQSVAIVPLEFLA